MFEPEPQLSSDLEWMLQSGQASPSMLAEVLVREHYSEVFRLCLCLLDNPGDAQVAALETFIAAAMNVHRFRHASGIRTWLGGQALQTCQKMRRQRNPPKPTYSPAQSDQESEDPEIPAYEFVWRIFDMQDEKARLALIFSEVLDWPLSESAAILRVKEKALNSQVDAITNELLDLMHSAGYRFKDIEDQPRQALRQRWPEADLTQYDQQAVINWIQANLTRRKARRGRLTPLAEVLLTVIGLAIVVGLIWVVSRMIPDPTTDATPEPLTLPSLPPQFQVYTPPLPGSEAYSTSVAAQTAWLWNTRLLSNPSFVPGALQWSGTGSLAKTSDSLTFDSTSDQILQRLASSAQFWNNLWLDAQVIYYGPPSYIGPPVKTRLQAWVAQPAARILLFGPADRAPLALLRQTAEKVDLLHPVDQDPSQDPAWIAGVAQFLRSPQVQGPVFALGKQWTERGGGFQVVDTSQSVGRQAVEVDWYNPDGKRQARLTVDASTGLVLRERWYGGPDGQVILSDFIVSQVQFDPEIPPELLNEQYPWQRAYTLDAQGQIAGPGTEQPRQVASPGDAGRGLLPLTPADPGFNPSQGPLVFQFDQLRSQPMIPDVNLAREPAPGSAQLFADGFFLGQIEMGLPWTVTCQRSQDGSLLVFTPWSAGDQGLDGGLRWFNLRDPGTIYQPMNGFQAADFSLAPNNRTLAVFGYGHPEQQDGAYLLDLFTGEYLPLMDLTYAHSLTWSPDGIYLALIGMAPPTNTAELIVFHAASRQVVYRQSLTPDNPGIPADAPVNSWGIPFPPPETKGMETCATPPAQNK